MSKIIIPTPLRKFTNQTATIQTNGTTVQAAIEELATKFPDLKQHLFDQSGTIRSFIRIFVGDDDIQSLEKEATKVSQHTIISIVPAIAGG